MSSNGCFQRPSFVRQLFQAASRGIGAITVIVDASFQFPSDAFYQELRALSVHSLSATGIERDTDELITLIKKLFEEIGIHVHPQDSQAVLEVDDVMLAKRFKRSHNRGGITPVSQSEKGTHADFARKCAEVYVVTTPCCVAPR